MFVDVSLPTSCQRNLSILQFSVVLDKILTEKIGDDRSVIGYLFLPANRDVLRVICFVL